MLHMAHYNFSKIKTNEKGVKKDMFTRNEEYKNKHRNVIINKLIKELSASRQTNKQLNINK